MAKSAQVKSRQESDSVEVAEQLSHLALGIAVGDVRIETEDGQHSLHPGHMVRMEIKGGEDRDEGKLVVELSWKTSLRIQGSALV